MKWKKQRKKTTKVPNLVTPSRQLRLLHHLHHRCPGEQLSSVVNVLCSLIADVAAVVAFGVVVSPIASRLWFEY
jgi:hypothetical protein